MLAPRSVANGTAPGFVSDDYLAWQRQVGRPCLAAFLHPLSRVSVHDSVGRPARTGEVGKRVIVAVLMLPLVASLVMVDARASAALFSAAAAVGCWEYYRLTLGGVSLAAQVGIGYAAVVPLVPAFVASGAAGAVLFSLLAAASISAWLLNLFAGERSSAPERIGHMMAGLLFSSAGLAALSALRSGSDGVAWTAIVLCAVWSNDTVAFFVGRAIGRHKLWPAVSPGKTWEGCVAGLIASVLVLLLIRPMLPRYLGASACVGLGLLAGILGPLGDLSKSMLKRAYGVKDTGRLLPGHGGMLDRIDGVLFVAPTVWAARVTLFPH